MSPGIRRIRGTLDAVSAIESRRGREVLFSHGRKIPRAAFDFREHPGERSEKRDANDKNAYLTREFHKLRVH